MKNYSGQVEVVKLVKEVTSSLFSYAKMHHPSTSKQWEKYNKVNTIYVFQQIFHGSYSKYKQ